MAILDFGIDRDWGRAVEDDQGQRGENAVAVGRRRIICIQQAHMHFLYAGGYDRVV